MPGEVIAVNEETNSSGLPQLEETTYTPKPKEDKLAGVTAAALADDDFVDTRVKRDGPTGVAAPVLAEDNYVDTRKKSSLEGVAAPTLAEDNYIPQKPKPAPVQATPVQSAPVQPAPVPEFVPQPLNEQQLALLAQRRAEAGQPPYTPEQIATIQQAYLQKQIDAHNATLAAQAAAAPTPVAQATDAPAAQTAAAPAQEAPTLLAAVQAPVLEETSYTPPPKKEPAVPQPSAAQAAALLEEPAEPERRVSRYNAEDLEAAKANAARRAVESTLNQPVEIDKEESRRLMNALRMEREAELAKKGFRVAIVLMILGLAGAVMLFLFSKRDFAIDMDNGFYQKLTDGTIYISAVLALSSVLLMFRVEFVKKLASFFFGLTAFGMLLPGVFILAQKAKDGMALTAVFYVLTLALCFAVCFLLSTNEAVNMYYKRREDDVI